MKFSLIIMLTISGFYFSQLKQHSFSEVETLQKNNPKPVIIHIYTDWCSVCKIESFKLNKDKELTQFINDHFYFISFEAEKTKETISFQEKEFTYLPNGNSGIHELATALAKNKNQPVYPLWIILDKNQKLIDYHEGLLTPKNMAEKLKKILLP
ncbi:thioredoxin family protein [Chryseobacterium binzhouense]|uniref:thioredoxin family protein n=1 Tax=Chryseobacterium binzhouense TaxID=2593646 RepID=UPI00117CD222|nr:thioredoxin fold domain-containing protein [Chryseobacterium binzhouense]